MVTIASILYTFSKDSNCVAVLVTITILLLTYCMLRPTQPPTLSGTGNK